MHHVETCFAEFDWKIKFTPYDLFCILWICSLTPMTVFSIKKVLHKLNLLFWFKPKVASHLKFQYRWILILRKMFVTPEIFLKSRFFFISNKRITIPNYLYVQGVPSIGITFDFNSWLFWWFYQKNLTLQF